MRSKQMILAIVFILLLGVRASFAQSPPDAKPDTPSKNIKVTLLGTAAGPPVRLNRYQMSTLVEAGGETLLFDCGRGTTLRLAQAGIPIDRVSKVFITHLHSDHIVDIPDLYLSPWAARSARNAPFEVWGPAGTRAMMDHMQKAFAFDIHIRGDVDEQFSPVGIKVISHDVEQGVVYDKNGVKVTSFLVDHGLVKPALGYRVDYAGHSVVVSGDTRPSENLVRSSKGVDVLIHEVMDAEEFRAHHPPSLSSEQGERIIAHHTSPQQAGEIFTRVKPRLAVFSHVLISPETFAKTRTTYSGPLQMGEDLMTIDIGDKVEVARAGKQETGNEKRETPAAKPGLPMSASPSELSHQQKADALRIISGAKERGRVIADRLAASAKNFDEVLLGEKADVEADGKAANEIKAAICDTSETRLQAARQVVHLLTPEQRRYLKAEMAKPGAEPGILEAVAKVFHVKVED